MNDGQPSKTIDLGPARSIQEMRDRLGFLISRFEMADGSAPTESWIMTDRDDLLCMRRLHNLLVQLAPKQERVRDLISGGRRERS